MIGNEKGGRGGRGWRRRCIASGRGEVGYSSGWSERAGGWGGKVKRARMQLRKEG